MCTSSFTEDKSHEYRDSDTRRRRQSISENLEGSVARAWKIRLIRFRERSEQEITLLKPLKLLKPFHKTDRLTAERPLRC